MKALGTRVQGVVFAILLFLLLPGTSNLSTVSAHAFGVQYTLPIPIWLYLYGGAAAIILSFLIIGVFVTQKSSSIKPRIKNLSTLGFFKTLTSQGVTKTLKGISVFLFLLTIVSGFIGTQESVYNFNMTWFWIIFLLGTTYLSAIIGNIYSLLNPWKILVEALENWLGFEFKGILKYPHWLSYYPAFFFYFFLIFTELIIKVTPLKLSFELLLYTLINFGLSYLFGKELWLKYCEFFNVFFSLLSKVSPFKKEGDKIILRTPFVGLIQEKAENLSLVLFILFMLSSTAFDGFHSTTTWIKWEYDTVGRLENSLGSLGYPFIETLALLLSPLLFFALYFLLVALMKVLVKTQKSLKDLLLDFAYTLIPIALVYNIAHYYTLLVIQGQSLFSLISDPFGFGWNLFGTINFTPNISFIDANFIWHSQVAFILGGHILAVYLAHFVALDTFPTRWKAVLSQFPMLILMVMYTMAGLWILSQPLTGG